MLTTAGACVLGSLSFARADSGALYFAHIASLKATAVAPWRTQITTARSPLSRPYPLLLVVRTFDAKCSASPAPCPDTASRIIRCLPGSLSNQSSSAWRAGCHCRSEAPCAYVEAVPPASAAPSVARPVPSRERNERRANGRETSGRCMVTSLGSSNEAAIDRQC